MNLDSLLFSIRLSIWMHNRKLIKHAETLVSYHKKLVDRMDKLHQLLSHLLLDQILPFQKTEDLLELAPLFPMAEVLSMQGYAGEQQRLFLQYYINAERPRYNLAQFVTAAVDRGGVFPEWNSLSGLDADHCGEIWHTLIASVCLARAPEMMQRVVDLLEEILYYFRFLESTETGLAEVRCGSIIGVLNAYAGSDQKDPYLHALMLLQNKLSETFGGLESDYLPVYDEEPLDFDMDGTPGFMVSVKKKNDDAFFRVFAVRKIGSSNDSELIWELNPAPGIKSNVFYSE